MRIGPFFLLGLGTILMFAGCATEPGKPAGGGNINISSYHTFAIAALPAAGPNADPSAPSRLGATARESIIQSLSAKGYREADPAEADFIVHLDTQFSRDPLVEGFEKRTLTIALHDRQSDALLWSNQRTRSSSRTMEPEIVRRTVIEMFASLPSSGATLVK